jgi:hypothetical protein
MWQNERDLHKGYQTLWGWLKTVWEKWVDDKGYFTSFVCIGLFHCWLPISSDKNVLHFLEWGGQVSHGKFYDLLLERKWWSESPSCICCFSSLQLKILNKLIIVPQKCIWGEHIWESFRGDGSITLSEKNST